MNKIGYLLIAVIFTIQVSMGTVFYKGYNELSGISGQLVGFITTLGKNQVVIAESTAELIKQIEKIKKRINKWRF